MAREAPGRTEPDAPKTGGDTAGPAETGAAHSPPIPDAVEAALAGALAAATNAERWDVVGQLARELEARRTAKAGPNVVALDRPARRRDAGR